MRNRLAVVLVGARNPQNIGAAARAMHDFGFSDLRVVNEFTPPFEAAQLEAVTSAVNAGEVMRSARRYTSLPSAIGDCSLIAGTTAVGERELHQPVFSLQEAAGTLLTQLARLASDAMGGGSKDAPATPAIAPERADAADLGVSHAESGAEPKVALLFGSEKTGLTRQELSFCSLLLTIPMFAPEGRHLSMNLGQSVAVCLYELTREGFAGSRPIHNAEPQPAASGDRERALALVLETMQRSGYSRRFPANARPEIVRQLVQQLGQSREEAATWMGFFRQLLRILPEEG
jgi:tRNA C32,U32 (ribose-2'-O)-methylase TrmJ